MKARHGTRYMYDRHLCRCPACTAAATAYRHATRDRCRDALTPGYLNELAASRAVKETYRGACEVCGKPTNGSNGPGTAAKRCIKHTAELTGAKMRGTGPQQQLVREFCRTPRRWIEIRDELGFDAAGTSARIDGFLKRGVLVRVSRGVYVAADKAAA